MIRRRTVISLVLILLAVGVSLYLMWPRVRIAEGEGATITFHQEGLPVTLSVTAEEAKELRGIVFGRSLYRDNPSCGFSENFSFCIGQRAFYIAKDDCCILQDAKSGLYLSVPEEDRDRIKDLFRKYGADGN